MKGKKGSAAQVTKKRKRGEENSIIAQEQLALIASSSSQENTRNPNDMHTLAHLTHALELEGFYDETQAEQAQETDQAIQAPAAKRTKLIINTSSSSVSSQEVTANNTAAVNPIDALAEAALSSPEAPLNDDDIEVSADDLDDEYQDKMQVDPKPRKKRQAFEPVETIILKKLITSHHNSFSSKTEFDEIVKTAKRYIDGDIRIIASEAKKHQKAIFLAAIFECQSVEEAERFLKRFQARNRKDLLDLAATQIIKTGTKEALDTILKRGVNLVDLALKSTYRDYIFGSAAQNPDELVMLQHLLSIVSNEEGKAILNSDLTKILPILAKVIECQKNDLLKTLIGLIPNDQLENVCIIPLQESILEYAVKFKDNGATLRFVTDTIGRDIAKKSALSPTGNDLKTPLIIAFEAGNTEGVKFLLEMFSAEELIAWKNPVTGANIIKHATGDKNRLEILRLVVEKLGNEKAAKLVDEKNSIGRSARTNTIQSNDMEAFNFLTFVEPNWTYDQKLMCEVMHFAESYNQTAFEYIGANYFTLDGEKMITVGEAYEKAKESYMQITFQPQAPAQPHVQNPQRQRPASVPNNPAMGNMPTRTLGSGSRILLSDFLSEIKDLNQHHIKQIKNLVKSYIEKGVEVVLGSETVFQRALFLTGVLANRNLAVAKNFLNSLPPLKQKNVIENSFFIVLTKLTPAEYDLIIQINPNLKKVKDRSNNNELHYASKNNDGGKMVNHIIEKLGQEAARELAKQTAACGHIPLFEAAQFGNFGAFDALAKVTDWKRNIELTEALIELGRNNQTFAEHFKGKYREELREYIAYKKQITQESERNSPIIRIDLTGNEDEVAQQPASTTQSAEQSSTPPILLSAALKDVKDLKPFRENLQKVKDLVARHVSGAEVISVGLTDAQKSVFLAAIIEYATSDKATEFLINHVENSQESKVLLMAFKVIASMFSTRALDIILQNDSVQLNLKDIRGPNLLHFAAQNKDGGVMISHILSKLSAEDKKVMLAATSNGGKTPLIQAAGLEDTNGFEVLQSVTENWRQNAEILKGLVLATQKNAAFKKHFEENYPNEYKLGQGIVNMSPQAPAPSSGRISPPNNQNGIQNLPAAALQPASSSPAPQFPANPLPDLSRAVERAVESLNQDLGFEDRRSSSSPSIAPLSASSGSLSVAPSSALSQTAMSSLDLFKALEQSVKDGQQTPISSEILARLKFLEGLLMGHEAVIASQKQSNEAPSRSI